MTTRTITLIRHAKSSWSDSSIPDFERPLNKRGTRDAPKVGAKLKEEGLIFERILCSDAKRARQTLELLNQTIAIDDNKIQYRNDMYGASADHLLSCIMEQSDSEHHIALVGHNPGMEDLGDRLSDVVIGSMSTCCVVRLCFECEKWIDILPGKGKVSLITRPGDL